MEEVRRLECALWYDVPPCYLLTQLNDEVAGPVTSIFLGTTPVISKVNLGPLEIFIPHKV